MFGHRGNIAFMTTNAYPPGPKQRLPASFPISVAGNPLGFLMDMARDYGDIVYLKLGSEQVYFINHPDCIKGVLVTHNRNFTKSRGLEMSKLFSARGCLRARASLTFAKEGSRSPRFIATRTIRLYRHDAWRWRGDRAEVAAASGSRSLGRASADHHAQAKARDANDR